MLTRCGSINGPCSWVSCAFNYDIVFRAGFINRFGLKVGTYGAGGALGLAVGMRLSDRQWELIQDLFPEPKQRRDGRGQPWASNRQCVEGILWVLRTGARWRDLPAEYPSGVTCWRLRQWEDEGVWLEAWQQLLAALNHQRLLEWDETFLDGSFVSAKKGALLSKKPSTGRGQSGWYWSMARAFLWERNWRVLHRRKSRSPNRRWQRSESRAGDGVVRGRNRNGQLPTVLMTRTRCGTGSRSVASSC